jgi:hypothetical protein
MDAGDAGPGPTGPAIHSAALRFLTQTGSGLLKAGAVDHAARLFRVVRRAGGEDAVPPAAQFRARLARQPSRALHEACRRLEATSGSSPASRVPGYSEARRLDDAELRETVIATVTNPRRGRALLPVLERMVKGSPGAVVPLALYLQAALSAGRAPNIDLASWVRWAGAFQWLFRDQPPELLRAVSRELTERFPEPAFLRELAELTASAPPIHLGAAPFRDRLGASAQFAPASEAGASTLLVCFCGRNGQIGLPVHYFQRWVQRLPAHALYLRDSTDRFYESGIAEFGNDWASLLEFVRAIAGVLGVERIAAYGSSMGGFAAVRAGAELGAARVVSMSGRTAHDEELNQAAPETLEAGRQQWRRLIEAPLRTLRAPPEIACVYGAENRFDLEDARALEGLPGVRLVPLPEYRRHNTGIKLAADGGLERVLAWVVGATDELSVSYGLLCRSPEGATMP